MRRWIAAAVIALLALFGSVAPAAAVTDNGTGIFWLYEQPNGAGAWRDFNVGPDQTINFSGLHYVGGCGSSCALTNLNDSVSSIVLSCGASGTAFSFSDWVRLYTGGSASGSSFQYSRSNGSCVNGRVVLNLNATMNNNASSMVTHNGG